MKVKLAQYLTSQVESGKTTKEALGKAAGISVSTVGQIMRGEIFHPPMKRLEGFAQVLRVSAQYLDGMCPATKRSKKTA